MSDSRRDRLKTTPLDFPCNSGLRSFLIFCLGFFAVGAQALLFRVFLRAFEGSELAVGCFFGSWLVWIVVGAWLSRHISDRVLRSFLPFELLPLLYLPAFFLQYLFLLRARELVGVQAYELFPFTHMAVGSFLFNAPFSFCTGLLFALGCRWKQREDHLPVTKVYMMEALGSFTGGITVTALLAWRFSAANIFLFEALVLSAAVLAAAANRRRRLTAAVVAGVLLLGLLTGAGQTWTRRSNLYSWQRLLPEADFVNSFVTSHAEYLYGTRGNQFVVTAWQSVSENIPDREYASEIVATHLAQHPEARKVLVLGAGSYNICQVMLSIPFIDEVAWVHPDPEYAAELLSILPPEYRVDDTRFHYANGQTVRQFLEQNPGHFDLAILAAGSSATLAMNSYRTLEFLQIVKRAMKENGVLGLNVPGGENFLDDALAQLGAVQLHTLQTVFANVAIKPGGDTWFFASDDSSVTEAPAALAQRLRHLPGVDRIFPPQTMLSLFPGDRIQRQKQHYAEALAAAAGTALLNTDGRAVSLYYLMRLHADQAGAAAVSSILSIFHEIGLRLLLAAIAILLFLRLLYRYTGGSKSGRAADTLPRSFDIWLMVAAVAFVNMALSTLLMVQLQAYYGALFLLVGLVSSVFMLGLFIGSQATAAANRAGFSQQNVVRVCLLLHVVILLLILYLGILLPLWFYSLLFLAGGIAGGGYIPAAVGMAHANGADVRQVGSSLEMTDHLGGALGAILVGILIIPAAGITATLHFLLLILAALLALLVVPDGMKARSRRGSLPALAYVLSAFVLLLGVARFMATEMDTPAAVSSIPMLQLDDADEPPAIGAAQAIIQTAERCLGAAAFEPVSVQGRYILRVTSSDSGTGFFLSTADFAADVYGYNGPVHLGVFMRDDAEIAGLWVLQSHETPSYFGRVRAWLPNLVGENILQLPSRPPDAVSGATMSATAVLRSLQQSGSEVKHRLPAFASAATVSADAAETFTIQDSFRSRSAPFLFAGFIILALLLRQRPKRGVRMLFLGLTCVVFGWYLNLQYSTEQIRRLLQGDFAVDSLNFTVIFILLVPLLVMVTGNIYCGYLCPFGALQELLGQLLPRRRQLQPHKRTWKLIRTVKYGILFATAILFLLTSWRWITEVDPLVSFFSLQFENLRWLLAFILLASLFCNRFWCRCLCPTGAFLALLNRVRAVRPLAKRVLPGKCDLGVARHNDYDCICCDRCRWPDAPLLPRKQRKAHNAACIAAVSVALLLITYSAFQEHGRNFSRTGQMMHSAPQRSMPPSQETRQARPHGGGEVRSIDLERVQQMIEQGHLSDQPASYYEEFNADAPGHGGTRGSGDAATQR